METLRGARLTARPTTVAVNEVLLSVDVEGLDAIAADLTAYLDDTLLEKRALAMASLIRMGQPLREFADRDREALLTAVATMRAEHLPPNAVDDLMGMVDDGVIAFETGVLEVARLSSDYELLFEWLRGYIDPARDIGFDQWTQQHERAMAALRAMHEINLDRWPDGYAEYVTPRAEPTLLERGAELYHKHEVGCFRCHGDQGEGIEGFPPLALSPWVLGDPGRAAAIVAHGLTGELTMPDGRVFNTSMSPEQKGAGFSDADVAAILTYIRQSWGNYGSVVSPHQVQAAPRPPQAGSWKTDDLLQRVPLSRDRILDADRPSGPTVKAWVAPRGGIWVMVALVLALNVAFGVLVFLGARKA
ncbi:MAG: cytochrome c [Planctomycetota bacterium]